MRSDIEWWQAAASFALIAVVVGLSLWRKLGIERSVLWAATRATVQLLAVGLLFTVIFESAQARIWSSGWVAVMVVVSAWVVTQRADATVPRLGLLAAAAIGLTLAVVLGVVFGLDILNPDPVAVVVIAGITIGNTMPSVVQAVDRTLSMLRSERGQIEALLALGFDGNGSTRFLVREVCRLALLPQIERTKVVGLIALPGAMTGLLLAGVDPVDAVLVQLVVMFMVLGAIAVSVVTVTAYLAERALTADLRLADWISGPAGASEATG